MIAKIFFFFRGKIQDLSSPGLTLGLLFLSASLTPSLIPRTAEVQGLLGGMAIALGYLLAIIAIGCWRLLGLPCLQGRLQRITSIFLLIMAMAVLGYSLVEMRESQNALRALMGMPSLEAFHQIRMLLLASMVFALFWLVAVILALLFRFIHGRMPQLLPQRVAILGSLLLVAVVSWNIGNGFIARNLLNLTDSALREVDAHVDPTIIPPEDALRTGSAQSLIPWESLGARGRRFIAGGFSADEISELNGGLAARTPIRVYGGLNSAGSIEERASLVLEEMIRVDAFARSYLLIVTPTGTGWIDENAADPFEVIHQGDTAIVGMQYSYLMSPLSVLVEPDVAPDSAKALVNAVYNHWRKLPKGARPKLYLHGLSLGSYGSEYALSPLNMIDDPINGALWVGPTYNNPLWKTLTASRNQDSPTWLPQVGDGRTSRFTTQTNALGLQGEDWSQMRLIFLQYPSDPITFFETRSAFARPQWMTEERAPDVLKELHWYPLITFLQLAIDMLVATDVPAGYGHVFKAKHYLYCWLALTDPPSWQLERDEMLLKWLEQSSP